MTLEDWLRSNWLQVHDTSAHEIRALPSSARDDLRSAEAEGISQGWRLSMAYTAALRYARAALFVTGYRPVRKREHERTVESLRYTLAALSPDTIRVLHGIRKKRHIATYESADMASDAEAGAAMRVAVDIGEAVTEWLRTEHPQLME